MARRRRSKGGDSDFVRLTGLWKPRKDGAKYLAQGKIQRKAVVALLDAMEDKDTDEAMVFFMKNKYQEYDTDPRFIISAIPLEDDDDDDGGSRRRRRRSSGGSKKKGRGRRRREEEEELDEEEEAEDDDLEDDDEEEDAPF